VGGGIGANICIACPRKFQLGRAFFLAAVVFRVIIIVEPRARECSSGKNTTQIRGYVR
jgi:hypothetical protein